MGFLTTITVYNDRLHEYKSDPLSFAEQVFTAMDRANADHHSETVDGGYIRVQPSFHADDHQLFVHYGNSVLNLNPYKDDFKRLLRESPTIAARYLKAGEDLVKEAKKALKQAKG